MIQNQTEILIKDNSGLLLGRTINAGNTGGSVGARIKVAVLKSKATSKRKSSKRNVLQDLILIQTKKVVLRNDGSSVKFDGNKGVCVSVGSRAKLQLGFKRINTTVPIELKKNNQYGGQSLNLMKLAKNIL
jgi:ribosomal protein L14